MGWKSKRLKKYISKAKENTVELPKKAADKVKDTLSAARKNVKEEAKQHGRVAVDVVAKGLSVAGLGVIGEPLAAVNNSYHMKRRNDNNVRAARRDARTQDMADEPDLDPLDFQQPAAPSATEAAAQRPLQQRMAAAIERGIFRVFSFFKTAVPGKSNSAYAQATGNAPIK